MNDFVKSELLTYVTANGVEFGDTDWTILSHEPGHASDNGICTTCGNVDADGPLYDRNEWLNRRQRVCFQQADHVVQMEYTAGDNGRRYRATYGVTREGDSLSVRCWAN